MKRSLLFLSLVALAGEAFAATPLKVSFTLNTTDANGAPLVESRFYHVYRPDGFPRTTPLPMILVLESGPGQIASAFQAKAAQMGFVVVSCSFSGNSTGTPGKSWNNNDPRTSGAEDYDYLDTVISRVKASDNCNDVFITGLSKGGHTALAYACERASMIKAAASVDEFMRLTVNIPKVPVPVIMFHGSADNAVPYSMAKDTVDAWRAIDGAFDRGSRHDLRAIPSPSRQSHPDDLAWRDQWNASGLCHDYRRHPR